MLRHVFAKPALSALVLAGLTLAIGQRARHLPQDNSPATFFAADTRAQQIYRELVSVFGTDELLLVRFEGARLDHPAQLRAVAQAECALSKLEGVVATLSVLSSGLFESAGPKDAEQPSCTRLDETSLGPETLRAIATETRQLPLYAKLGLVSDSPPSVGVVASLVMRGPQARLKLWRATRDLSAGWSRDGLRARVISLATANGAIDHETRRSLSRFMPLVVLLSLLVGFALFRSVAILVAILLPVASAVLLGAAALELAGGTLNIVTGVMPPLVFAVGFAGGLHLVSRYRALLRSGLPHRGAVERAVREKWLPTSFAFLTTALGFGSLTLSGIGAVRALGQSAAIGLSSALLLVVLGTPVLLLLWAPRLGKAPPAQPNLLERAAGYAGRRRGVVFLCALAVLGLSAAGVARLQVSFDGFDLLPRNAPERVHYQALERSGVGLGNVDLWLRLPLEGRKELLALAPRLERLAQALGGHEGISGVVGPQDVLRLVNYRISGRADLPASLAAFELVASPSARRRIERMLARFWQGPRGIKITLLTLTREDATVARRAALIRDTMARVFPGVPFEISGHFSMLIGTPALLIATLAKSLAVTVVVIFVLFALALRRPRLVLAGMAVNLLPVLAVFGIMGLLGVSIDVATVMTGSVVFGIAVDDTFHYLYHYRKEGTVLGAARLAGEGIYASSLIIAGGFAALGLSPFVPVWRFGLFTALAMGIALAADALLLPALIGAKEQRP